MSTYHGATRVNVLVDLRIYELTNSFFQFSTFNFQFIKNSIGCHKTSFFAIHRAGGVGGVGAVVVGGVGSEVGEIADEAARAAAVGGVGAGCGGAWRGAVADSPLDDGIAAIGGDIAATYRSSGGDSGGCCRDNCREPGRRGDGALLAIDGAVGIGGVGTYIVGG